MDIDRVDDETLQEVKGLVNPDGKKPEEFHYDWPHELQQRIIGSLLSDEYFLLQGLNLIRPQYFTNEAHAFFCKRLLKHYEEYTAKPDKGIMKMYIHEQTKGWQTPYYLSELESCIDAYSPGAEKREFFLDRVTEFAKTQAMRSSFSKSLDMIMKNKNNIPWADVRHEIEEALLVERNVDIGLDYFETAEERYKRMKRAEEDKEKFPTGYNKIDVALSGGLCRGELAAVAGMSGQGKSIFLVNLAYINLKKMKKVLYVSLEMDEDKVAERFDALFTDINIMELLHSDDALGVVLENQPLSGKLVIKQFPAGQADVMTVRAYLSQLQLHGFCPDMMIVDYVGEMRDLPGMKTYESRQRLVRDLRGLATEKNICVLTAMQINRGGRDALDGENAKGYLDDDDLADSAGQVRPLDALWTLSQNAIEQKANIGTIFTSKHRSGKSRDFVYFRRDPKTLRMSEIAAETRNETVSAIKNKLSEDASDQAVKQNKKQDEVFNEGMDKFNYKMSPNGGGEKGFMEGINES